MAMGITDTILLGALGNDALAAGGLGATLVFTIIILLQGALTAVSVLVSQARGAGRDAGVPVLYWTGLLLALLLAIPAFALFTMTEAILLAVGEPPTLARDTARYTDVMRWGTPGAMVAIGLMRAFLPAIGRGAMLLWVSIGAAVLNGFLCYGLIHGTWGLPAMGLEGAALASAIVLTIAAAALLALLHGRPALRHFVAWTRPDLRVLGAMLRLGVPVSGSFAVEAGLFLAVGLMIGLLGAAPLAAQQIALSVTSVAFMIPLAIAQAANVRVGHRFGALDLAGA
ncbi:MAG: MATE family efflux transporter, partial [Gemmatimonadaceae bacterium]|nr:MATE family efflux transporter [Acetobacteraceae bacterium]